MSTRGLYGFRKDGVDKLTYNHFDSYPDCLGETIVKFCKGTSVEELNEIFDKLIMVNEHKKPTKKQINACMPFYDRTVSNQTPDDWYCLLRLAQGAPELYKCGLIYMIDNADFIKDSLFCEYAYIINLDTNELEFWVGFQKTPCEYNRYGTSASDGYYPCKMVSSYPIGEFMNNYTVDEYVHHMNKKNKED